MRRDKTAARILLILSVVHVAVAAAPAVVRRRSLGVAEGLTPALEKRADSDDEWPLDSYTLPHPGSVVSRIPDPASDSSRYLEEPADSGSDPYFSAPRSLEGSSPSSPSDEEWPPPVSPTQSFHEGSECRGRFMVTCWRLDYEDISNHDSVPGSSSGSWRDPNSVPESSTAGLLQQHSASAAPPSPPAGSHEDLAIAPSVGSPPALAAAESPSGLLHEDSPPASPLPGTLFNGALKKKIMVYSGIGAAIVGVSVGLTIGIHKLMKNTLNTRSHKAYVVLSPADL